MTKIFGAAGRARRRLDQGRGRRRSTRCSARTAPASRRSSNASWASTRPIEVRSCSTARRCTIRNPRDARALGIGMVYQHFTLVPSLTGAENLVISRADAPAVIDWKKEMRSLEAFLDRMPFRVPLDVPVVDARRRREAEARNPQAALSRPAPAHPRRADLGAHAGRSRRDARPPARHGAAQGDHRHHDHAQVPRGAGVLRTA